MSQAKRQISRQGRRGCPSSLPPPLVSKSETGGLDPPSACIPGCFLTQRRGGWWVGLSMGFSARRFFCVKCPQTARSFGGSSRGWGLAMGSVGGWGTPPGGLKRKPGACPLPYRLPKEHLSHAREDFLGPGWEGPPRAGAKPQSCSMSPLPGGKGNPRHLWVMRVPTAPHLSGGGGSISKVVASQPPCFRLPDKWRENKLLFMGCNYVKETEKERKVWPRPHGIVQS